MISLEGMRVRAGTVGTAGMATQEAKKHKTGDYGRYSAAVTTKRLAVANSNSNTSNLAGLP
jgi:hypothetical protein